MAYDGSNTSRSAGPGSADTLIVATTEENGADPVTLTSATSLWSLKSLCRMIANVEDYKTGKTIREVVREKTDLSEEDLDELLDAKKMTLS